jgi:hypothetical protein
MTIIVTIDDIIKRGLWTKYKYFVLKNKNDDEIDEIIKNNETISLNENDAYVIGLLKCIETHNLIHVFKLYIEELLNIKSIINEEKVVINKSYIIREIIEYKNRFPESYKPDKLYNDAIIDLNDYINIILKDVENLNVINLVLKDGKSYTFIYSNDIKKLMKKK